MATLINEYLHFHDQPRPWDFLSVIRVIQTQKNSPLRHGTISSKQRFGLENVHRYLCETCVIRATLQENLIEEINFIAQA